MNILHISSAKTWRGGERQVHFLIKAQFQDNHVVYLMCPGKSPLKERCLEDVKRAKLFKNGVFGYPMNIATLIKICKERSIDVIHGHDSHAHTLIWMAYKMGVLKTPSVITRRLGNPISEKSKGKYNHDGVKKIICISEAVRERMLPQIENVERLETIHSGIDLSEMSQPKDLLREGPYTIGYVAAFTKEKDHGLFVEIALHLLRQSDQFRFILVGDGPLLEKTKSIISNYSDKFQFMGFVNNVNEEYKKMDLLLHTAKLEALGTSILDAMKFGIPIVANDVGGINEIVKHGKNGYLVKQRSIEQSAEFVMKILGDPQIYERMSKESLSMVRSFGINEMYSKTMDLYTRILRM